ncbi:Dihydroorotase [Saccharopolyspora kobensis]|uniref:Dihydroorotase n=1 Tax=Saccharopolyspora kobensis TaxID=146035 RepID=A0A1H6CX16_9PSEU|nr:amidohydrolase family protein [Saccharopolyspora kobensis]SEG77045.1 Dihydroorotase [Saccharopolyspora kobensis]SFD01081.1 Dihydroorotase [Saccharopolyspora kobensis]
MCEPQHFDLVLAGARVIDPETGLDGVRNVGIDGRRIGAVTTDRLTGNTVVDVSGRVLAPGFIDLHSHAQTVTGLRLQAMDGVTTALELEAGALPVRTAYDEAAAAGRPINFGFSAGWALARMHLLDGAVPGASFDVFAKYQGAPNWRRPVGARDLARVLDLLEEQVRGGALGIGMLVGYAPDSGRDEYFAVASLAARLGVPTFTHTRFISTEEPGTSLEGALEVIAAAAGTGAHMHMCHINSTSNRMIDDVAGAVERARGYGVQVTTEAYPYGSASTVIGAAFLAPEKLHRLGMQPRNILRVATGERIADAARLAELREQDPGALILFDWLDESDPADLSTLQRSLLFTDTAIASDAVPLVGQDGDTWPVADGVHTHPRSVGCYARTFGWLVRELGVLSLAEAVRRCTLLPARILEPAAPAMRRKGRIQVGADADVVVFDPGTIASPATGTRVLTSTGVDHVLVGGTFVVRDAQIQLDRLPGEPVFGRHRD